MAGKLLILLLGLGACASAVIMIKASTVHPVLLSAWRLLIAALVLSPLLLRELRRTGVRYSRRFLLRSLLPGAMLAGHFISWTLGARRTTAANATLIVNMLPVVMPFLLYLLVRERITRGELAGTAIATVGLIALTAIDAHLSFQNFLGDLICLGSLLCLGMYMTLARRNRDFPSIWIYVVPLYALAGVICLLLSLLWVRPWEIGGGRNLLLLIGLGVVPTVMGHSILNWAMKHMRGQFVSLACLGEFIFAGFFAWWLLGEVPGWSFAVGCSLIVAGAAVAVRGTPPPEDAPAPLEAA